VNNRFVGSLILNSRCPWVSIYLEDLKGLVVLLALVVLIGHQRSINRYKLLNVAALRGHRLPLIPGTPYKETDSIELKQNQLRQQLTVYPGSPFMPSVSIDLYDH